MVLTPLGILDGLISVFTLTIFVGVLIPWLRMMGLRVPHYHPVIRFFEDTTEAVLRPIRRALPVTAGGWDFSPMVALVLLMVLRRVLHQVL